MRVEDRVIPARFLVTIGHLIAVLMVFKTKVDNVYVGLGNDPTAAQVASAEDDVDVSVAKYYAPHTASGRGGGVQKQPLYQ